MHMPQIAREWGGENTPSGDPLVTSPPGRKELHSRTLHQAVFDFSADQTAGKGLEECVARDSLIFFFKFN